MSKAIHRLWMLVLAWISPFILCPGVVYRHERQANGKWKVICSKDGPRNEP
jgi:hypothetical protein